MCFGLVFPRVFLHQHANYLLYVQTIPGETCVKYPKGHSVCKVESNIFFYLECVGITLHALK